MQTLFLGEVPQGKPHASNVREEDIELVDADFDADGNVVPGTKKHSGFAGRPDQEVIMVIQDDLKKNKDDNIHKC